ncbi:MAG: hypothetical protein IJZ47_12645 [Oscillospiraceae bacterium]|nr:hypothetical protein [Oscillospiraceae bacterium]
MCERIYFPEGAKLGAAITVLHQGDTDAVTAYRIIQTDEYSGCITLADIEVQSTGVTIVISEDALKGRMFRYGNHGPFWEEIGRTCGYA